jgi:hypothetical protein
VNLLYRCEQVNLQHTSRRAIIRPHGSAERLVGLEAQGWGNGEAEGLGRLQVDDRLAVAGRSRAPTQNQPERLK